MPNVTIAAGSGSAVLTYNVNDRAFTTAQTLGKLINTFFGGGAAYPAKGNYVYDVTPNGQSINVTGSANVVIQNSAPTTVVGGGAFVQTILASNGGLTFTDTDTNYYHNEVLVVGGPTVAGVINNISFAGSNGTAVLVTDSGKDKIALGNGTSFVTVGGVDTINLGRGDAVISIDPAVSNASAVITGSSSVYDYEGYALAFTNGAAASTVIGGAGSYAISGGSGGGVFQGGSNGYNYLAGGSGAATITGGGSGDIIIGQSGHDSLIAGSGYEAIYAANGDTVVAGSGNDFIATFGGSQTSTVKLGSGQETISAGFGSHVLVSGSTSAYTGPANQFSAVFYGSDASSTVTGGTGSYFVEAGNGGGNYAGGSAGHNVLFSDYGTVTLLGGAGGSDLLSGGFAGRNLIKAGGGNSTLVASYFGSDTLVAGAGADTLSFVNEVSNRNYTVQGYNANDLLLFNKAHAGSATIPGADKIVGGNSVITLSDNTKITLVGYTGSLNVGHN